MLNTCPRGTPSAPCSHRERVHLHRDRRAMQGDIEERARREALIIEPRHIQPSKPVRKKKRPSLLDGLSIGFKMWKPFSSKEGKRARRRTPAPQVSVVEYLPRAPTPPPAWVSGEQPIIIESEPRRNEGQPENEGGAKPQRKNKPVVLHQDSSDSDDETLSSPEPTRVHERPQSARSLSSVGRAEVEKALRHETELRLRAERTAKAERKARIRAEKDAWEEEQENLGRIKNVERPRLETAERARRLRGREEAERAEQARIRQEQEDIQAIRRADRIRIPREEQASDARRRRRQPRPTTMHQDLNDFERRGDAFIDNAIANSIRAENMARFERTAPRSYRRPQGDGLRRRGTVDGSGRRQYEGPRRRHERRFGGSG